MKRFIFWMFSILALVVGMGNLSTFAANADDTITVESVSSYSSDNAAANDNPCQTVTETEGDNTYVYNTCAEASSAVTVASHATGKAKTDSQGRLILSFIMPGGLPESQQNQCKTIPAGHSYVNNYYDSTGQVRWVKKVAPPGGVRICFVDGKWHVVKCGNVVLMKPPPAIKKHLFKGKYVERDHQKIWSEAIAKANGTSHSAVRATNANCPDSYAEASADGSFTAVAKARAWGWTKTSSVTAVQGQVRDLKLEESTQQSARANAAADARGNAKTKVAASITCTPQQPGTPAPMFLETDTINDVLVNNSRTITVTGTVAPGHSATLFASAKNGGSITAGKTQTVTGSFTVQVTYQAPSEVPGANNGVAAGHDQVGFTLTQDDGQSAATTTNSFVITQLPPDPL